MDIEKHLLASGYLLELKVDYKVNKEYLFIFAPPQWTLSSVGLEHYLDRVGVTGSNPVAFTKILILFVSA